MGAIGQYQITPFGRPAGAENPDMLSSLVRGNDNVIVGQYNAHDADAALHVVSSDPVSVSSGAETILPAPSGQAVAFVSGDDGGGNAFVDVVAWHPSGAAVGTVSSTTTDGSPAARTYSLSGGALQLAMAAGTYMVQAIPLVF